MGRMVNECATVVQHPQAITQARVLGRITYNMTNWIQIVLGNNGYKTLWGDGNRGLSVEENQDI